MDTKLQSENTNFSAGPTLDPPHPPRSKIPIILGVIILIGGGLAWILFKSPAGPKPQPADNPNASQPAEPGTQEYIKAATQQFSKISIPTVQSTAKIDVKDLPPALAEHIVSGAENVAALAVVFGGEGKGYQISYQTPNAMAELDSALKNILTSKDGSQKWDVVNYTRSNKANMIEKSSQNFEMRVWLYPVGNGTQVSLEAVSK